MNRRAFLRKVKTGSIALASLPVVDALATPASANDGASHVRWDIMHVDFTTTPRTFHPGGVAFASADAERKIKFTGSGTFVAPPSGGTTGAVTGGGTWETSGPEGSASGTYEVKELLSWQFANTPPPLFTDDIDDVNEEATGNAILRIAYSDGKEGILGLGCNGAAEVEGIQEGVIATKGYFTYWTREAPTPGVDADRTLFHVN